MDIRQDVDPTETQEWTDALKAVVQYRGPERANFLVERVVQEARREGAYVTHSLNTPYMNTIPPEKEERSLRARARSSTGFVRMSLGTISGAMGTGAIQLLSGGYVKTKHITLAVAATLLAPAAVMADSSVEIYGRLNLDFERVRANGSTIGDNIPSRNRVSSNSSMIGFRGTEDLGGDLKAFFQVESQINADTGTATATTGVLAGRNSGVGLKGGWGSVLMGRWDTPYKIAHVRFDPFRDVTIASDQNVLGQMSTTPSGDFHPRFSNSIQYWTPELAGFSGRLDYSANEGKTDTVNPSGLSGALYYDQGPFYAALAHERHNDSGVLVAGAGGDDKGTVAGFGFKFGSTKLGLLYERLEYKTEAAGGSNLRRNAWFLSGEHRIDAILLRGYYGDAGNQSGSFTDGTTVVTGGDTGAKMYSLGVAYTLSKRSELYVSYTRINNESNATYEFGINPTPGLAVTKTGAGRNPGIDPSGFLIGMVHLF